MIPKIIHYTWFSGEEMPSHIVECMDSWRKFLPNYEIRQWDTAAIGGIAVPYLEEALKARKWAYASDFVRAYALYHYGGIYLDTDVMLYKSLDEYLNFSAFIGKETSIHFEGRQTSQYLTSHCFGAEQGHPFVSDTLSYYMDRHFEMSKNQNLPNSLRYNIVLMPYIQSEIARIYGYQAAPSVQDIQHCKDGLTIFPSAVFDPDTLSSTSVCKHLALGSWRDTKSSEPSYSWGYKMEWRLIALLQKIVTPFHYKLIKYQ